MEAARPAQRTKAPDIPRRIHRGRVLALLGRLPGHRASVRALARALEMQRTPVPGERMADVLLSLQRDHMISLSRRGRSLEALALPADVSRLVACLVE